MKNRRTGKSVPEWTNAVSTESHKRTAGNIKPITNGLLPENRRVEGADLFSQQGGIPSRVVACSKYR